MYFASDIYYDNPVVYKMNGIWLHRRNFRNGKTKGTMEI